jgi:hypothetical protein
MKVEHYSFGRIIIDGHTYTSDVIIYQDKVDPAWWRKAGHSLHIDDLKDVINLKPEILIIGTGQSGVMVVPEETLSYLKGHNIEVHVERTGKAVELFNKIRKDKKTFAALHLTC